MYQLFLDSNTYLAFYNLSPNDINELAKLAELLEQKRLKLLLPAQVIDEVRRNRAKVVADRIKPLQDGRIQVSIPPMVMGEVTAEDLKRAAADVQRIHSRLLGELRDAGQRKQLPADLLIKRLFDSAEYLEDSNAIQLATTRKALGNPPGKGSSLGDGVNWEILLAHAKDEEELCLVSADGDFASALDANALDEFLSDEWEDRKGSGIRFYRDIKQFLDATFPAIRLTSDVRKYLLIEALIESGSFVNSHAIVADLNRYDSFSQQEALRLLSGGLENNQVRWLARDDDVKQLLDKVLGPHRAVLPKSIIDRWDYVIAGRGFAYGPVPTDEDLARPEPEIDLDAEDDMPF